LEINGGKERYVRGKDDAVVVWRMWERLAPPPLLLLLPLLPLALALALALIPSISKSIVL
jgi:hypothetical protein